MTKLEKPRKNEIMAILESVVTPAEIEALYGVKADTVRDACERGWIMARKSGSTWLIPAKAAKERWGKVREPAKV